MRILLGLAILITLALMASSRKFWSLRRTALGAVLTTGGWLMIGVGMLLGPHGAGLVSPDQLLVVKPLILFCLGWVGLMVGLQAHRSLLTKLPGMIVRVSLMDVLLSVALIGGGALGVMWMMGQPLGLSVPLALVLGTCAISWSAEVRSLPREGGGSTQAAAIIRGGSGLGSIFAILAYAVLVSSFTAVGTEGTVEALTWSWPRLLLGLGASLMIGLAMGLLGLWLMRLAGRGEGEFLVVLLGLVSFTAGAAATMGYSSLFVSMLTGAVLVNMPGKALERLKRVIIEAEQPLAMVLMLVAGIIADPRVGEIGLWLIAAIVAVRVVVKMGPIQWHARWAMDQSGPVRELAGLMRQSPVAIALALAWAISEQTPAGAPLDGAKLLTVVILVGLTVEAVRLVRTGTARRSTPAKSTPPDTPDTSERASERES